LTYSLVFDDFTSDLLDVKFASFWRLHGLSSLSTAGKERFLFDTVSPFSQGCRENKV
jgi:hypothetical protein